jgi:F-type H+-transporting ATPase subunit gamma
MPSLKDLKTRIDSVKSTRKITKAMQMVAAAKLRRAQDAAEASRPYAERFNAVLGGLARAAQDAEAEGAPMLLRGTGSDQVQMLVVMTAERGLCGGFNSSIVRMAKARIIELEAQGKTVKIITVGKKGREQLKREYAHLFVEHIDLSGKQVTYPVAQEIAQDLIDRFDAGEFDVATIFFSTFQSVISQIPTEQQVIPATFDESVSEQEGLVYDYEPSEDTILAQLLPKGVATAVFAALLENGASFNGAQMSAMDSATRNAGEMIEKLTIQYNRSRQAAITKELIEIISGAEAL